MLSDTIKQQIDTHVAKYPKAWRQSAVMPALTIVQDEHDGYLTPELIEAVATYLEMPTILVQEVATFYAMYEHQFCGKYKICVCHNISCMLKGSDELIDYLERKLGVRAGEVSKDGKFSIKKVECLAACGGAPMMQIDDTYYENLTPDKIDNILDSLP